MSARAPGYAEIVVKVTPWRSTSDEEPNIERSTTGESKRSYHALIYTKLPLSGLAYEQVAPPGQPTMIAGMPLVAVERIRVRWSRYQEYLAAFIEGDKAPDLMRQRLLEVMSPGLEGIFNVPPPTPLPVRLWWSSDTPEVEDLPWELLTYRGWNYSRDKLSFVRGLPPEAPAPIIPVEGRLRLAFIHKSPYTPSELFAALQNQPNIDLIDMQMQPHKALLEAVAEGYELIHIVSDALVSSAYEGVLSQHTSPGVTEQISPGELSSVLRSSRASVLGLTAENYSAPDTLYMAEAHVPSAYRAFAYLGSSRLPMPSMVAPLGPLQPFMLTSFWGGFYSSLAQTFNLHKAMSSGLSGSPPIPVALFLRHRQEVLFRRVNPAQRSAAVDPVRLGAALQLSQELVDQLRAHQEQYGSLPNSVEEFIANEGVRQVEISSDLDPWLMPNDEEAVP